MQTLATGTDLCLKSCFLSGVWHEVRTKSLECTSLVYKLESCIATLLQNTLGNGSLGFAV